MSNRLRRSPTTTLAIQAKRERRVAPRCGRATRATSIASPVQTLRRRSSSTAIGGSPSGARRVLEEDDLLLGVGAGLQRRPSRR